MQRYAAKRIALFVPTILLVTLLVFLLMRVLPGDPALLILAGETGEGVFTEEDLSNLRHRLGTDRPTYVQYGDWLWGAVRGDLGTTLFYRTGVVSEIAPRLPLTLQLAVMAAIISSILAVPLGIISAIKQKTVIDYAARIFTFTGISIPTFVVGLLVVFFLVRIFNWFPPLGYATITEDPWKNLQQMIFPALTLAFFQLNLVARVTRSAMLEVMREDYIRTARSKGLREFKVIFLHALKNAFLPVITVSGWSLGILLGGSVIIEKIFVVPGMGVLLIQAIGIRDYTLITGLVVVFATGVIVINLLVDLVYAWLDPRIRYS